VLGRGLLREFPNPERTGCPDATVLKGIAAHKLGLADAERWFDHITSCSPCYRDVSQFREAYELRRRRTLLAVAASVLIVASVAGWALAHRRQGTEYAQTAVLDLRNRSVSRGPESNPSERPLEVNRAATHWTIYLPLGSAEGTYDVRIVTLSGEPLVATSGTAKLKDQVTSLYVAANFSPARPGRYVLEFRRAGAEWNSFPILLR